MLRPMLLPIPLLAFMLSMTGCKSETPASPPAPRDPQVEQAINDPLMTDPDLSAGNEGAAALTVEIDMGMPVLPVTPETIAAAKAEAGRLVGGEDKLLAPPRPGGPAQPLQDGTFESHLAVLPGAAGCNSALQRSAIWAARLPAALPVYPRGATTSAAGNDQGDCKARVVGFTTPVPLNDVLAFYWTRARLARLSPRRLATADGQVIVGQRAGLAFDLRASEANGFTTVRLATLQSEGPR